MVRYVGGIKITVLAPSVRLRTAYDTLGVDCNDASIVLKVEFPAVRISTAEVGGHAKRRDLKLGDPWSIILGADAQTRSWSHVTADFMPLHRGHDADVYRALRTAAGRDDLAAQILKVSHHASKHGINIELIERMRPRVSLISSVGGGGRYGFPHALATQAIAEALVAVHPQRHRPAGGRRPRHPLHRRAHRRRAGAGHDRRSWCRRRSAGSCACGGSGRPRDDVDLGARSAPGARSTARGPSAPRSAARREQRHAGPARRTTRPSPASAPGSPCACPAAATAPWSSTPGCCRGSTSSATCARLDFVSSVSGGSLAAGVLALAWPRLRFDAATGRAENLDELVLRPLREMAGRDVDKPSVISGLLTPRQRISDRVADAYREHLFGDATLQDLPDTPRFVFCATNLQTTSLFRFSKRYVADYRLGLARDLAVPLAVAVGASSAFPPYLSPATLRIPADAWDPAIPQELAEGLRDPIVLTDGGVYDNLGLEPVIKRCTEILVSNGGGYVGHPARIPVDWLRHLQRVSGVVDHQVRSLRKRMLVQGYRQGDYRGAYWSIRSATADYLPLPGPAPDPLPFPPARARELAAIPTPAGPPRRRRHRGPPPVGTRHFRHRDAPLGRRAARNSRNARSRGQSRIRAAVTFGA